MFWLLRSPPPGRTPYILGIALLLFLPAITLPGEATDPGASTNVNATDAPSMKVLPTIRVISGNKGETNVQDGKNITFEPGEPSGNIYFGETCMDDVIKVTEMTKMLNQVGFSTRKP
ncbi:PREDICTED: uncharacterized protein LOC109476375 [Branchiostoma belcheri]|uniref:Uncharacterized protein LOC109476375 n=1 Tax=Branchiostoma belcheri TaxID=7741 RepID=A0A6P4Z866_BRABE|nr:PREDICTED: uncharacterized protein LOC109476375 [Branchiostoma belcheri]